MAWTINSTDRKHLVAEETTSANRKMLVCSSNKMVSTSERVISTDYYNYAIQLIVNCNFNLHIGITLHR